jgi:hypothetical protein
MRGRLIRESVQARDIPLPQRTTNKAHEMTVSENVFVSIYVLICAVVLANRGIERFL